MPTTALSAGSPLPEVDASAVGAARDDKMLCMEVCDAGCMGAAPAPAAAPDEGLGAGAFQIPVELTDDEEIDVEWASAEEWPSAVIRRGGPGASPTE